MTASSDKSVSEVLASFDDEFSEVASAFARGEYLLWLGSGLSRGIVPNVETLLQQVLEFLQQKLDCEDPSCRFRKALGEVFEAADIDDELLEGVDLREPVATWPRLPQILRRMSGNYSSVLAVRVDGEMDDYLVWDGLNVTVTYGSSRLQPDIEHLCVAILMLEGVVTAAPTTNWDGLVEKAMARLTEHPDAVLNVVVRPDDFDLPAKRSELLKFHGCAVRAAASPSVYRDLLIARRIQISAWCTNSLNRMMKGRLEFLLRSKPAFVIGLSAQDQDIHTMLHQASQDLVRVWPTQPPAVVFAAQTLSNHHKHMLEATYGASYSEIANRSIKPHCSAHTRNLFC